MDATVYIDVSHMHEQSLHQLRQKKIIAFSSRGILNILEMSRKNCQSDKVEILIIKHDLSESLKSKNFLIVNACVETLILILILGIEPVDGYNRISILPRFLKLIRLSKICAAHN